YVDIGVGMGSDVYRYRGVSFIGFSFSQLPYSDCSIIFALVGCITTFMEGIYARSLKQLSE
nr:hypothetical protein [Tanacetum cinerariifolium]